MSSRITRRAALAIMAIAGTAIGGVGALLSYVTPAQRDRTFLLPASRLPGEGVAVVMNVGKDRVKTVAITNPGGSGFLAFVPKCTHLGCRIAWKPDGPSVEGIPAYFECPCHQARFSLEGERFAGPAPRNLDRYASRLDDHGALVVDTGTIIPGAIGKGVEYPPEE